MFAIADALGAEPHDLLADLPTAGQDRQPAESAR
jgi:hypothetical protein